VAEIRSDGVNGGSGRLEGSQDMGNARIKDLLCCPITLVSLNESSTDRD
jgi:hypothetical protein